MGLDICNFGMQPLELQNIGKSIDGMSQNRNFAIILLGHNLSIHLCASRQSHSRWSALTIVERNCAPKGRRETERRSQNENKFQTQRSFDITSQKIPTRKLMRKIPDANMKQTTQIGPIVRLDSYKESQS